MSTTKLILNGKSFKVQKHKLMATCDLFEQNTSLLDSPYHVRSVVSTSSFEQFLSALDSKAIDISNSNYRALCELCNEFVFSGLNPSLSAFDLSRLAAQLEHSELVTRVAKLEVERATQARVIGLLQSELSSLHSSFDQLQQLYSTLQSRYESLISLSTSKY
jgi:uncharacterized coiled-coil protein SlyX